MFIWQVVAEKDTESREMQREKETEMCTKVCLFQASLSLRWDRSPDWAKETLGQTQSGMSLILLCSCLIVDCFFLWQNCGVFWNRWSKPAIKVIFSCLQFEGCFFAACNWLCGGISRKSLFAFCNAFFLRLRNFALTLRVDWPNRQCKVEQTTNQKSKASKNTKEHPQLHKLFFAPRFFCNAKPTNSVFACSRPQPCFYVWILRLIQVLPRVCKVLAAVTWAMRDAHLNWQAHACLPYLLPLTLNR